ncbi:MAG: hypothetical protein AB1403_01545 [Candidatus Riflebacteria bacterium]
MMKKLMFWLMSGVFFLSLFLLFRHYNAFTQEKKRHLDSALIAGKTETLKVAEVIRQKVSGIRPVAEKLADEIASGRISGGMINEHLKKVLQENSDLAGIGVYFLSVDGDPRNRANLPFYAARPEIDNISTVSLVQVVDVPIFNPTKTGPGIISGHVVADVSRWSLKDCLHHGQFGTLGFPFLVNEESRFLTFPGEEYDAERKTLYQMAQEKSMPGLAALANMAIAREAGFLELKDNSGEVQDWSFTTPIEGTGWSICSLFPGAGLKNGTVEMRRHLMLLPVFIVICLISLSLIIISLKSDGSGYQAWCGVIIVSLFMIAGIAAVWYQVRTYGSENINDGIALVEAPMVSRFQEEYIQESRLQGFDPPKYIPTGLFIQSISFQSSVDVSMTGYIWQKYPVDSLASMSQGVIFPEATECEFTSAYERTEGNEKIIGWYFTATLREPFKYATYPLDQESIWIRMWHQDFDKNIVLVPDFFGYTTTNPAEKPGIDKQITLPGWEITRSFFCFKNKEYNSNFGLKNYQGQQNFPELFFNVVIRRDFLDPFISNILPIFLVMSLMFILKLTVTKDEQTGALLGFNANVVLSGVAALFFIVVFAQIDLRAQLSTTSITYMDYYYFVVYLIFLVVSVDAIIFSWTDNFAFIHYRDNLIPKLLYWPMALAFIYGATLYIFFP